MIQLLVWILGNLPIILPYITNYGPTILKFYPQIVQVVSKFGPEFVTALAAIGPDLEPLAKTLTDDALTLEENVGAWIENELEGFLADIAKINPEVASFVKQFQGMLDGLVNEGTALEEAFMKALWTVINDIQGHLENTPNPHTWSPAEIKVWENR